MSVDPNVMRVFRSLHPEPSKADVPEMLEASTKFLKEGDVLLHDEGGTGRSEARHLFLFSTCLLICVKSDKAGKWQLKVLMRMASGVSFEVKGGLLFAVTKAGADRSRTFLFGCLEQHECNKWKAAFTSALDAATRGDDLVPAAADADAQVGSLLLGLKGALGGADDVAAPHSQANQKAKSSAPPAPKAAAAAAAAEDDDDDPFAAIARRPSKNATTAAPTAFDLFGAPAAPAPAAAAAPSGKSALSGDALMALYAQSAAAPAPAPSAALFGAPPLQPQPQQPYFFAAPAVPQQQPQQQPQAAKPDPFASLL